MFKKILFLLLFSSLSNAQVVINELDSDQAGIDTKEFVELKSATANFSLNGYVLVFFNGGTAGTSNLSYLALDLDGLTTNVNGLVTIGNSAVVPSPNRFLTDNSIQNGPDAVGLYLGNPSSFPAGTAATTTNLINALVYKAGGTGTATALQTALGNITQINENLNNAAPTESIQRLNDGTYIVALPTPRAVNEGVGIPINSVSFVVTPSGNLTESNSFNITFSTQTPVVSSDLNFNFTLTNGNFDTLDYNGNLSVLIPIGATSTVKNIILVDDILSEGDETMLIFLENIPASYSIMTNNVAVRIHDNDNIVKPWGNPMNPTYNTVTNTKPIGYYSTLEGKTGAILKQAIQDIIASNLVREHSYGDAYEILKDSDSNPANSSQIWLMYVETPRSKLDFQTGSSGAIGFWNREHIYPQSRGGFTDGTSNIADGIGIWLATSANTILSGHSDMHHIRAEDSPENSIRSERNYGVDYNGPAGNAGSWKGDVARAVFYMAVRYNGLNVINGNPPNNPDGFIGDLTTLLTWNFSDPSDDFEMNRNNIIYDWQVNRNPFIDHPDLANHIWGANVGQPWFSTLSTTSFDNLNITMFPNPTQNFIIINGLNSEANIEIFSTTGISLLQSRYQNNETLKINLASGIYLVKIQENDKQVIKKLIVK